MKATGLKVNKELIKQYSTSIYYDLYSQDSHSTYVYSTCLQMFCPLLRVHCSVHLNVSQV